MTTTVCHPPLERFRVWIVRPDKLWRPHGPDDVPPSADLLDVVDDVLPSQSPDGCVSARQAAAFIEGLNKSILHEPQRRWAVALPVACSHDDQPRAGQRIEGIKPWPHDPVEV